MGPPIIGHMNTFLEFCCSVTRLKLLLSRKLTRFSVLADLVQILGNPIARTRGTASAIGMLATFNSMKNIITCSHNEILHTDAEKYQITDKATILDALTNNSDRNIITTITIVITDEKN